MGGESIRRAGGYFSVTRRRVLRWSGLLSSVVVAVTLATVSLPQPVLPASAANATAVLSGFNTTTFGANDDGTYPCTSPDPGTPPGCTPTTVPIGFPIDFFGTTYSSLYVNNNGNLTFNAPLAGYTPFGLAGTSSVIMAPFFADVDTRVGNQVTFGTGTVNGHAAFGVTWPGVGCYQETDSVTDDFQAVLINRSDIAPGDFDIEYNYNSIQWDAGEASGGTPTCQSTTNANAAAVGYSNGTGAAGTNFELAGSQTDGALLSSNVATGLTNNDLNPNADNQGAGVLGRYIFEVRAGTPLNPTTVTTSLSGGTQSGATITVPPGTGVSDAATIGGASSTAGGTITYTVYSDSNCSTAVASSTDTVTNDVANPSNTVTLLTPGTYYWQASYSGDAANDPSTSTCGAEVETVVNPVALSVTKTVSPNPYVPGSPLTYTITASNAGPGTATAATVSDPLPSALSGAGFTWTCAAATGSTCGSPSGTGSITASPTIASGGHVVYTLTGTVPSATTGTLSNTATVTPPASASDPGCSPNCSATATDPEAAPSLLLTKTASVTSVSAAGATFTYSFALQNTGNTGLSNITIHDAQTAPSSATDLTNLSCPDPTLALGGSENCTATYTVSQADMDNGSINDTATATGIFGTSTVTSNSSSASVSATQAGAISITKSASAASVSAPGPVTYTFTVKNTGNVSLSGATITDSASFGGLSGYTCAGSETNGSIALAVGASETCTATESVTQGQIDAGTSLVDTASVSAATPASDTTQTSVSASSQPVTVTITPTPKLSVVKTASVSSVSAANQTFTYTFAVTNNGNVTESSIGITDTQTGASVAANLGPITCPQPSLAPGASENCTATYTVSQADMDAGTIQDTAKATGTAPNGSTTTSGGSGATVAATQAGAISITKSASVTSVSAPGPVTYTFTLKNTGNVSLTGGFIADSANFSGLSGYTCAGSEINRSIALAVGASETCTATENVTQAQIDAGTSLVDTALGTAIPPESDETQPGVSATSNQVTVTVTQTPKLSVVKSASVSSVSAAGSTFTYTFAVTNNGNVTESSIGITDAQTPPSAASNLGTITCPQPSLAPGASENCSATYTVSQADMDAGTIQDTANATGTAPDGSTTTSGASGATVAATQAGAITITKTASAASVSAPGPVTYTFTLTNNGNVDLSSGDITDSANFTGLSALSCDNGETNGSIALAVGDSETCTATESVTQAQIDAGTSLVDTASVSAATPSSDTSAPSVNASSSQVTVTITQTPKLSVVKTASVSSVSAAGQTFTYTFAVTNNGNVTESSIGITDTQTPPSAASNLGTITCPQPSLAPGASENCTATYTVSQADMDAGSINDTAQATGTAPNGSTTTSGGSGATVGATQAGAITITKSASAASVSAPGPVTYTFTVKNTGNVSLSGATITDSASFSGLSAYTCAGSETNGSIALAVGASETCTATESVTQAQIDAGTSLVDTASVSAATPASDTAQPSVGASSSPVTVTITQSPSLKVVKSASVSSVAAAGATYTYTFAVTNNGNVTESSIGIADTQSPPSVASNLGPITCSQPSLAPGAAENCTATYTVSQADMDAGSIGDTAEATGTAPNGSTTKSPGYGAVVMTVQKPAISLAKTATGGPVHTPGSKVTYTFSIGNPGNVTLNNVGVTDQQAAPALNSGLSSITCVSGTSGPPVANGSISLAPGATATCTATYTATAADIANGVISDTGTANGNSPLGKAVTATSSASVVASAPIMTGEANDATVAVGLLGAPLPLALVLHDTGAVATAKASTTATPCALNLPLADLVISGDVCSDVTTAPATNLTPATSTAAASVAAVAVGVPLLPVIDLQAVQSNSTTTCAGSIGSTTIAYLKVGGDVIISKPTVIAPNTTLTIGLVTLVLNQQFPLTGADRGLLVNAVDIRANVLGLVQANVTVGSSESDIENC